MKADKLLITKAGSDIVFTFRAGAQTKVIGVPKSAVQNVRELVAQAFDLDQIVASALPPGETHEEIERRLLEKNAARSRSITARIMDKVSQEHGQSQVKSFAVQISNLMDNIAKRDL